jgi:hypothetical protein
VAARVVRGGRAQQDHGGGLVQAEHRGVVGVHRLGVVVRVSSAATSGACLPAPGVLVVLGLLASLVPGVLGCCILGW